jgi:hypothetical protein
VPVAAARQAEVVAADLDPLEVGRRSQHPAQKIAVGGLGRVLAPQGGLRLGDPLGQFVAQLLQLAEIEHPRGADGGGEAVLQLDPAEGLGEMSRQLLLEAPDLAPQLRPRETLVDLDGEGQGAVSCKQSGHRPETSLDHAARVVAAIHSASSTAICGTPFTCTATTAMRRLSGPTS